MNHVFCTILQISVFACISLPQKIINLSRSWPPRIVACKNKKRIVPSLEITKSGITLGVSVIDIVKNKVWLMDFLFACRFFGDWNRKIGCCHRNSASSEIQLPIVCSFSFKTVGSYSRIFPDCKYSLPMIPMIAWIYHEFSILYNRWPAHVDLK